MVEQTVEQQVQETREHLTTQQEEIAAQRQEVTTAIAQAKPTFAELRQKATSAGRLQKKFQVRQLKAATKQLDTASAEITQAVQSFETEIAQKVPTYATAEYKATAYENAKTSIQAQIKRAEDYIIKKGEDLKKNEKFLEDRRATFQRIGKWDANKEDVLENYNRQRIISEDAISEREAELRGWREGLGGGENEVITNFNSGYTSDLANYYKEVKEANNQNNAAKRKAIVAIEKKGEVPVYETWRKVNLVGSLPKTSIPEGYKLDRSLAGIGKVGEINAVTQKDIRNIQKIDIAKQFVAAVPDFKLSADLKNIIQIQEAGTGPPVTYSIERIPQIVKDLNLQQAKVHSAVTGQPTVTDKAATFKIGSEGQVSFVGTDPKDTLKSRTQGKFFIESGKIKETSSGKVIDVNDFESTWQASYAPDVLKMFEEEEKKGKKKKEGDFKRDEKGNLIYTGDLTDLTKGVIQEGVTIPTGLVGTTPVIAPSVSSGIKIKEVKEDGQIVFDLPPKDFKFQSPGYDQVPDVRLKPGEKPPRTFYDEVYGPPADAPEITPFAKAIGKGVTYGVGGLIGLTIAQQKAQLTAQKFIGEKVIKPIIDLKIAEVKRDIKVAKKVGSIVIPPVVKGVTYGVGGLIAIEKAKDKLVRDTGVFVFDKAIKPTAGAIITAKQIEEQAKRDAAKFIVDRIVKPAIDIEVKKFQKKVETAKKIGDFVIPKVVTGGKIVVGTAIVAKQLEDAARKEVRDFTYNKIIKPGVEFVTPGIKGGIAIHLATKQLKDAAKKEAARLAFENVIKPTGEFITPYAKKAGKAAVDVAVIQAVTPIVVSAAAVNTLKDWREKQGEKFLNEKIVVGFDEHGEPIKMTRQQAVVFQDTNDKMNEILTGKTKRERAYEKMGVPHEEVDVGVLPGGGYKRRLDLLTLYGYLPEWNEIKEKKLKAKEKASAFVPALTTYNEKVKSHNILSENFNKEMDSFDKSYIKATEEVADGSYTPEELDKFITMTGERNTLIDGWVPKLESSEKEVDASLIKLESIDKDIVKKDETGRVIGINEPQVTVGSVLPWKGEKIEIKVPVSKVNKQGLVGFTKTIVTKTLGRGTGELFEPLLPSEVTIPTVERGTVMHPRVSTETLPSGEPMYPGLQPKVVKIDSGAQLGKVFEVAYSVAPYFVPGAQAVGPFTIGTGAAVYLGEFGAKVTEPTFTEGKYGGPESSWAYVKQHPIETVLAGLIGGGTVAAVFKPTVTGIGTRLPQGGKFTKQFYTANKKIISKGQESWVSTPWREYWRKSGIERLKDIQPYYRASDYAKLSKTNPAKLKKIVNILSGKRAIYDPTRYILGKYPAKAPTEAAVKGFLKIKTEPFLLGKAPTPEQVKGVMKVFGLKGEKLSKVIGSKKIDLSEVQKIQFKEGRLFYTLQGKKIDITMIDVPSKLQGKNIGTELIKKLVDKYPAKTIQASSFKSATGFYKKLGFKKIGLETGGTTLYELPGKKIPGLTKYYEKGIIKFDPKKYISYDTTYRGTFKKNLRIYRDVNLASKFELNKVKVITERSVPTSIKGLGGTYEPANLAARHGVKILKGPTIKNVYTNVAQISKFPSASIKFYQSGRDLPAFMQGTKVLSPKNIHIFEETFTRIVAVPVSKTVKGEIEYNYYVDALKKGQPYLGGTLKTTRGRIVDISGGKKLDPYVAHQTLTGDTSTTNFATFKKAIKGKPKLLNVEWLEANSKLTNVGEVGKGGTIKIKAGKIKDVIKQQRNVETVYSKTSRDQYEHFDLNRFYDDLSTPLNLGKGGPVFRSNELLTGQLPKIKQKELFTKITQIGRREMVGGIQLGEVPKKTSGKALDVSYWRKLIEEAPAEQYKQPAKIDTKLSEWTTKTYEVPAPSYVGGTGGPGSQGVYGGGYQSTVSGPDRFQTKVILDKRPVLGNEKLTYSQLQEKISRFNVPAVTPIIIPTNTISNLSALKTSQQSLSLLATTPSLFESLQSPQVSVLDLTQVKTTQIPLTTQIPIVSVKTTQFPKSVVVTTQTTTQIPTTVTPTIVPPTVIPPTVVPPVVVVPPIIPFKPTVTLTPGLVFIPDLSGRKKTKPIRKKLAIKEVGYDTYVKPLKKKRFVKANLSSITKQKAKDLGSYITDTSLGATYKIKRTTKNALKPKIKVPDKYAEKTKKKFRDYEIKKGKRKPLASTWIEKRNRRLDTPGEVRKITALARIKKLKSNTKAKKLKVSKSPFSITATKINTNTKFLGIK